MPLGEELEGEAEPVAWMYVRNHQTDFCLVRMSANSATRRTGSNWTEIPLYAAPLAHACDLDLLRNLEADLAEKLGYP